MTKQEDIKTILESMNLKPRTRSSALFNIALAYSDSANLANNQMNITGNADFAGPAIMCLSFSTELLLKFFIFASDPNAENNKDKKKLLKKMRGHKFTVLFDRIDSQFKIRITEAFSNIVHDKVDVEMFREKLVKIGDDPFVKWRYIYEAQGHSTINTKLARDICDALGKAAEVERKKETK